MTKEKLKRIVDEGVFQGKHFLGVKIETEGVSAPEITIIPGDNIYLKMAHYEISYTDDLELISAKEVGKSIKITGAIMANDFREFERLYYF